MKGEALIRASRVEKFSKINKWASPFIRKVRVCKEILNMLQIIYDWYLFRFLGFYFVRVFNYLDYVIEPFLILWPFLYFCLRQNVLSRTKIFVQSNLFLSRTIFFCLGQFSFVMDKFNFVLDKIYFVLDKIYFVRAEGRGITKLCFRLHLKLSA